MRRIRTFVLVFACVSSTLVLTQADEGTTRIALSREQPPNPDRVPFKRPNADGAPARETRSGNWWFSTVGIVTVLALLGVGSLAAKRWKLLPGTESGPVEILGRTYLSQKHALYVVRAGGQTLLIGTGPQGAPSLLTELPEPSVARLAPLVSRGEPR